MLIRAEHTAKAVNSPAVLLEIIQEYFTSNGDGTVQESPHLKCSEHTTWVSSLRRRDEEQRGMTATYVQPFL